MRAVAIGKVAWPRFAMPWDRSPSSRPDGEDTADSSSKLLRLVDLLRKRQGSGKATALRQLHAVSGVDQPRALRLLRQLQNAGLARIEPDLHDPLGSLVVLTPEAFGVLDEVLLRD